jgi:HSP20 family protein
MNAVSMQELTRAMDREMERLFASSRGANRSYTPEFQGSAGRGENGGQNWSPAVDVVETPDAIVLHAELPGMKKEEIEIQLSGETLAIRGERQPSPCSNGENFHRIERRYGRFSRAFQIETPIDAAQVQASYDDGVLTVRLPKAQSAKPRQIEITSK